MKLKRGDTAVTMLLYSIIAGLLIGIAALALFLFQGNLAQPAAEVSAPFVVDGAEFDGILNIEPPLALADFTLVNQDGAEMSLRALRGHYTLLTFGFTHCPDICPLTLHDFQQIRRILGVDGVQFVFISVDGARDTPAALKQYLGVRQFDDITALTGDEAAVRQLGDPLGVNFEISDEPAPGAYLINHTAGAFLLDQEGRWVARFQFGVPPSSIADFIRERLAA